MLMSMEDILFFLRNFFAAAPPTGADIGDVREVKGST